MPRPTRVPAVTVLAVFAVTGLAITTLGTAPAGAGVTQEAASTVLTPEAAPVLKADYMFRNNRRSTSPAAPARSAS